LPPVLGMDSKGEAVELSMTGLDQVVSRTVQLIGALLRIKKNNNVWGAP
jgi:hypothetical protein